MKKLGIGSRLLALLLALTMLVSMIPGTVFAADGDFSSGVTGLDTPINTQDTISWPIKVYDYLNDGLLFEYASANHYSLTDRVDDSYGGGEIMPNIELGNDYTVNGAGSSSASTGVYTEKAFTHWLKKVSGFSNAVAEQGKGQKGAFKFLRLQPDGNYSDMPGLVLSDFTNDNGKSYDNDRVRYAVLVYKTNVTNLLVTLGMSASDRNGQYYVRYGNDTNKGFTTAGVTATGPNGETVNFELIKSVTLNPPENSQKPWNYVVIDTKQGPNGTVWDQIGNATQIILDSNMTNASQYLDLSHVAYFADEAEAKRFGERAAAFSNTPGEYLPDQSYDVTIGASGNPRPSGANFAVDFTTNAAYSSATAAAWANVKMFNNTYVASATQGAGDKIQFARYGCDEDGSPDSSTFVEFGSQKELTDIRYMAIVYRSSAHSAACGYTDCNRVNFWYESSELASLAGYSGIGKGASVAYYRDFDHKNEWTVAVYDLMEHPDLKTEMSNYNFSTIDRVNIVCPGFASSHGGSEYMDISHIAFFDTQAKANAYGQAALTYNANPGTGGASYSGYKHWNTGNNTAFTMLYASSGGGWRDYDGDGNAESNIAGGENSWPNGYRSYQIGYSTAPFTSTATVNQYREDAREDGYPVPDDIYFFNAYEGSRQYDLSTYDFGYTLYNLVTHGVMTAGLLQNELVEIKDVNGKTQRIPEYKPQTVEYIARLLQSTLTIGETDQCGNYNYNFVKGSPSSQFGGTDLATALRNTLGLTERDPATGNYVDSVSVGQYYSTSDGTEGTIDHASDLIGAFADVQAKGSLKTYMDAAYYLLHNLYVDNSYNQLQDDFNYLVLSKAKVTGTDKEAFVFDAGFTTGDNTADSRSAIKYDYNTGTISLTSSAGKDLVTYNDTQKTTRFPFLPVQDAEGDYAQTGEFKSNGTPYFLEDGAANSKDWADTYATRNYNYAMQANAEFIFQNQDDLFFQFEGDDDVYLFVNNELVLDIGAAHDITKVKMNMNDYVLRAQSELATYKQNHGYRPSMTDQDFLDMLADAGIPDDDDHRAQRAELLRWHHLNLVDGQSYPIDFYYMERHGWGANMRVATNIVMTDPAMDTEKKAYQDGAEINYAGLVDGDKAVEYSFSLTNEGQSKLYNLRFHDYDIGVSLTPDEGLVVTEVPGGGTVTDARGQKLDPSDLVVQIDGYLEETKLNPVSMSVRFNGQNPMEELKAFLRDLTSSAGTQSGDGKDLFSGSGLWRHATVTIRGIYYKLSQEQIKAKVFNNAVFTTANPSITSETILTSEDTHQVQIITEAEHIYQWAGNGVYFDRTDVVKWLGNGDGTITLTKPRKNSDGSTTLLKKNYTAANIKLDASRSNGDVYDYPDIFVNSTKTGMTVEYLEPGSRVIFIKAYNEADGYEQVYALAVHVTDIQNDVVVLDYGLKAELTGKNGITANDYITVPNLATKYTIMGMTTTEPVYLEDISDTSKTNYNRISFDPAKDQATGANATTLVCNEGDYSIERTAGEDDKLYFTPTGFMDEPYTIYIAVTIHEEDDEVPHAVGTVNTGTNGYSIDITKEVQMFQQITVLPATVMYYENDFAALTYKDGAGNTYKPNIIGGSTDKVLQGVDQSVNYGADQVYQTGSDIDINTHQPVGNDVISAGSMAAVPVSKYDKLAEFTFTGTGFELIGRTNAFDSSSLTVTVQGNGEFIRLPLITEFSNTDKSVCKHEYHNPNGHCKLCGTYVGHIYQNDVCVNESCQQKRLDYYLIGFINEKNHGCEEDHANLGDYKFVNGKLIATFQTDSYVFVKTTPVPTKDDPNKQESVWFMANGYPGTGVKSTFLYNTDPKESGNFNADKLHVPGGVELTFTLAEYRDANGKACLNLSYTTANDDEAETAKTVYLNNSQSWTAPHIYYWSSTNPTMAVWPGVEMVAVRDEEGNVKPGIFKTAQPIPADAEYVLFNGTVIEDGQEVRKQTKDLTVPGDSMIFNNSEVTPGWSTYTEGESTVYFQNTKPWPEVFAYYWAEDNEEMCQWPGVEMTLKSGSDNIYQVQVPDNAEKIVFNNGKSGEEESKTDDLNVLAGDTYVFNEGWVSEQNASRVIFFRNTEGWKNVAVYYWSETNDKMVAWPGNAMEHVEDDLYRAVIPGRADWVVFNDTKKKEEGGQQTPDVLLDPRMDPELNTFVYDKELGEVVPEGGWSVYGDAAQEPEPAMFTQTRAATRTIYVDNDTGWSNVYIYYWNGADNNGWPGALMTKVEGNRYSYEVPVTATNVIFNDNAGTQTPDLTFEDGKDLYTLSTNTWSSSTEVEDPTPPEEVPTRTVYVDNDTNWSNVYIYYWNGADNNGWPGALMTKVEGNRYSYEVPVTATNVIFNDNAGTQTPDLTFEDSKDLYTLSTNTWSSSTEVEDPTPPEEVPTRTVYVDNDTDWSHVYIYYWNGETNNGWPGAEMTLVEGNRYSYEVPLTFTDVIINNGSGTQTNDLTFEDGKDLLTLSTEEWSSSGIGGDVTDEVRTIYYANHMLWSKVNVYYWSAANASMVQWPGVEMTKVSEDPQDVTYALDIPANAQFVIFNNEHEKTEELILPVNGSNYYSKPLVVSGTWEHYDAKRTVYFDLGDTAWGDTLYAYTWNAEGDFGEFPGTPMTALGNGLYSIEIYEKAANIIFSDGTNKTADLDIPANSDQYTMSTKSWSSTTRTIYYEASEAGSVRLTYWLKDSTGDDKIMTQVEGRIYSCEIPADAVRVQFWESEKPFDAVPLSDDHNLYADNVWEVYDPISRYFTQVYFENTLGWKNVHVHFWSDSNENMVKWPGNSMTFVEGSTYTATIPSAATYVVFSEVIEGQEENKQTKDLTLNDDKILFVPDGAASNPKEHTGTWVEYIKPKTDAIHQVPTMRVDGLKKGTYTVEIHGVPTYVGEIDWAAYSKLETAEEKEAFLASYVKPTYLYLDGVRIYQPMGDTNENYSVTENGASFVEMRNLILKGHAAVAQYSNATKTYSGNVSWTENRNGTGGDLQTTYVGNQLGADQTDGTTATPEQMINDYMLIGPNNEAYLNGNAQTQAVIFYATEDAAKENHALQVGVRGIDAGLFLGSDATGINATLYYGVVVKNPNGTTGYGWRPLDTVLSGTEQYYTIDYTDCPIVDGSYQIALYVRSGMVSFTNVKYVGLTLEQDQPIGSKTALELNNGTLYDPSIMGGEGSGSEGDGQDENVEKAASMFTNLSNISSLMEATREVEQPEESPIDLKYPSLSFEDEVFYNIYYTIPGLEEEPSEMGLAVFDSLQTDGTLETAVEIIPGFRAVNGMYAVRSNGVAAKDLGKTLYFRVFAQLADGRYVYSDAKAYSAIDYAKSILTGNSGADMKAMVAAMLNYGAAAQGYFGGLATISDLLTDSVCGLIGQYSPDLLDDVVQADSAKAGSFAATSGGFGKKYPAAVFEGAFAINYHFTPAKAVQGDMILYYWNAEDYANAETLTAENATGSIVMTPGATYTAALEGIAAKDMDETLYVAAVYESEGVRYSSGVLAYSLASYCESKAAAGTGISLFAKATAIYAHFAKKLFG